MQTIVLSEIDNGSLLEAYVWYDGTNSLMVRYNFEIETDSISNVQSIVFNIDKNHLISVLDAFHVPEPNRTIEQNNIIIQFQQFCKSIVVY